MTLGRRSSGYASAQLRRLRSPRACPLSRMYHRITLSTGARDTLSDAQRPQHPWIIAISAGRVHAVDGPIDGSVTFGGLDTLRRSGHTSPELTLPNIPVDDWLPSRADTLDPTRLIGDASGGNTCRNASATASDTVPASLSTAVTRMCHARRTRGRTADGHRGKHGRETIPGPRLCGHRRSDRLYGTERHPLSLPSERMRKFVQEAQLHQIGSI